jgi:hypothetical protein
MSTLPVDSRAGRSRATAVSIAATVWALTSSK